MNDKYEYEMQLKYAELQKYNPEELIKPHNSRILFEVINEAKENKQLKEKLNKIKEYVTNKLIYIDNEDQETILKIINEGNEEEKH